MRFILILLLLFFYGTICFAQQMSRGFNQQYLTTLRQVLEADHEMFLQLKFVSFKLEQFFVAHKHFPNSQEERDAFKENLSKYIIANPYHPVITDQIDNKRIEKPYEVSVFWMEDQLLEKDGFMRLLAKPDPSWQGEPGTIFILTNGRNTYLLWAATADRLPMRDLAAPEQPPRMICKEIELQD